MKRLLILLFISPLVGFNQPEQKMPPMSMLNGEPGDKKSIFELSDSTSYVVFDLQGAQIDSGYGEFIDVTDYDAGRYFIKTDDATFPMVKEEDTLREKKIIAKNKPILTRKNDSNRIPFFVQTAVVLLIVLTFIILVRRINRFKKDQAELLHEINKLKSNGPENSSEGLIDQNIPIDKQKISGQIDGKLNDSDWKIIEVLTKTPSISNSDLANHVSLSVDGTKSSLKKMYRLFEIPSSRNMRLALALRLLRLSKQEE